MYTFELVTLIYSDEQNRHGPCPQVSILIRVGWISLQGGPSPEKSVKAYWVVERLIYYTQAIPSVVNGP